MINPITRTKQFVERHKVALTFGTGVTIGFVGMTYVLGKYPLPQNIIVPLDASPDEVFELMKKSGGFDITNAKTGQKIQIVTNQILEQV